MNVKQVICAAGRSGYMHRDLMAIKAGARQDGMIFHGNTVTPGFRKIVEPATIISVMLVLEDGQVAFGDCADVILAGVAGRDTVFNAADYMEVMQGPVAQALTGRDISKFRANAEEFDKMAVGGKRLHTALRYGITQALLHASALAGKETMAEVIAREYGSTISKTPIGILASGHKDDPMQLDRIILKRAELLPHASFTVVKDHVGLQGEILYEWVKMVATRIKTIGDADYNPRIHADLYGTLGELFSMDVEKIADYIGTLREAAAPYSLLIESPMIAKTQPEQIADYAKIAAAVTAEIAELATMPNDSQTRFKGTPSAVKHVAWSAPLPLADIKAVCKVLGVSVNDILLASVAGAMRSYLAHKGDDTEGIEVRGFVPVNLRPRGAEHKLGNHFGLVALVLPVGIENPFVRLYDVKRRMDDLKSSYQAALSMGILGTVGFLPRTIQKQVLDMFSSKGSAVMTNVPGPQQALHMAGARLEQQMFWVPQSGDIGIGVSILSYNGQVQFGLVTDRKFVNDPQAIVDRIAPEFEKLVYWLLLEGVPPAGVELPAPAPATASHTGHPAHKPETHPAEDPHPPTVLEDSSPTPAPTKARRLAASAKKAKAAPRGVRLKDLAAAQDAGVPLADDHGSTPEQAAPPATPPRMKKKGLLARARA